MHCGVAVLKRSLTELMIAAAARITGLLHICIFCSFLYPALNLKKEKKGK